MYSRTLLDILFLIWGHTVADYKMLSFHLSINVIIIVVSFKILDLCPIALFQQLWNTLYLIEFIKKWQIAVYYKSVSVGYLWSSLLRHYHPLSLGLPVLASRRLSYSVSSAFRFLLLDLTCFILETVLLHTNVFQTSSAFIVKNLSASEIYLCWLISRSSLQSGLTPLVLCIFIKRCYACFN